MLRELIDTVRQPEYTGENRCPPCTIVNLAIAAALGAAVSRKSKRAGALTVAGSVVLIYLRGYLVPGTPELTKRYLPPSVLRWFGKDPSVDLDSIAGFEASNPATNGAETDTDADADATATVPNDLETYFLDAGLLEPCTDRDDLCLTDAFESAWVEEMDAIVDADSDPLDLVVDSFGFDANPNEFELTEKEEGGYVLHYGTRYAGRWPSNAALIADIASGAILDAWLDEWDEYTPRDKGKILNSLRMFLEVCPTAEGGVELNEELVESCCTSNTVIAVVCEETGERVFEHQVLGDQRQTAD
ncbi:hypothetical protein DM868_05340 [Natronomonas salsuginis]|uniref:Uncharacterized protein n=1 Tax=Natronomonas salsuginis TaxID=2217661 RepID=A0A4U5JIL8_9EURY|nr:hypothetical protein DM868_05340 [Natronomonas salsuginis]